MPGTVTVYLDVETDWSRQLTVVGLKSSGMGLVQLVGSEITRKALLQMLPPQGRVVTYNGHCFDLPCIRSQLDINLREMLNSCDLRWICQRCGLTGGQKGVEKRLGIQRVLAGMGGLEAIALWQRHLRGDANALRILLQYNAEDLDGLVAIERHLIQHGHL